MRSRLSRQRCPRARLAPVLAALSLFALAGAAAAGPAAQPAAEPAEAADPPHPLAARYPGKLVVVCEAGCSHHRGPEIVYMERIPQRRVAVQGMMQPTSATLGNAPFASSGVIECVAGCYDTPRFYQSPIVPTRPATALKSTLPVDPGPPQRGPFSPIR